jgi:uncharacterized protein (TIGR03437 family)
VRKTDQLRSVLAILLVTAFFSRVLVAAPSDQVRGSLVITVADYFAENRSETRYFIEDQSQPGRTYELLFAAKPPDNLRTGMVVTGRGHIHAGSLEGAEIEATESHPSTSSPSTGMSLPAFTPVSGVQKTLVYVLQSATPQNNFSDSQLNDIMFAQSGMSVNTLYRENSFGSVSFAGDVVGPYTITVPTTCDTSSIRPQADQAATAAGVDISVYPRRVYMMPKEMQQFCNYGGVSTVGGNPGLSWINTGYYFPTDSNIYGILQHELGHQLGMSHAQAIKPDGSLDEYGDTSCLMGGGLYSLISFNVPHLIQEGWLPLSNIQQVSVSGIYQVAFAEQQTTSVQALQIVPPGTADALYVSYRQPHGQDSNLPPAFVGGASIHYWNVSGDKTQLATFYPWGGALSDGQTYTSPNGNLSIEQISHTSTNVTLNVAMLGSSVDAIGAVTNAASFTANSLSPGSIATIWGTNLATSTAQAGSTPLPIALGLATVTVNGIPAPLIYASSLQINFQIPYRVPVGTANLVVSVGGLSIPPFSTSVQTASPGIFEFGSNRAVAQNPDYSLNNSNNPVAAGSYITAYLTGIGPLDNPVGDGTPAPAAPLSHATSTFSATIGSQNANVIFLGLTPGFVGLAQANITIPSLPSGNYPLVITVNGVASNGPLVTVAATP